MRNFYVLTVSLLITASLLIGCNESREKKVTAPAETNSVTQIVELANYKCPIMGGKPKAELTAHFQGKTIGFCCEGCPEKWAALSDEKKAEKFASVGNESHSNGGNNEKHGGHDDNAHKDDA